jgi:hypothetical protein
MTAHGTTEPRHIPGDTPAERLTWVLSHLSLSERSQMEHRRAARIRWLRVYNPDVLPIALRAA